MSDEKLTELLKSFESRLLSDEKLTEKKRIPSSTSSTVTSEKGSVVYTKAEESKKFNHDTLRQIADQDEFEDSDDETDLDGIIQRGTTGETQDDYLDDDDDDDFNDYIIEPPLPPPKELHPGKLYALYDFSGNDPSHCELQRDDATILLNDQDSYWWLVKKEANGKIGFAPAECLETYHERLARLNCWKNEELEKTSKATQEKFAPKTPNSFKMIKTVEFSSKIINHSPSESIDYGSDVDANSIEARHDVSGEFEKPPLEEDLNSDLNSDSYPVDPLTITKRNKPKPRQYSGSDYEEETPLIAPSAFFQTANSTNGSIGTYSPSSSEFESPGDTPPLTQSQKHLKQDQIESIAKRGNIPQSKGVTDIANSMKMLDDIINDEWNTSIALESEHDDTITYDDDADDKLSSPIDLQDDKKNMSNITNSTFTNSNTSLHLTESTTSFENEDENESLTIDEIRKQTSKPAKQSSIHPEIGQIFQPSLSKMDELSEKLRLLNERLC